MEAQLFVFYFACHIGEIVNSVYCLKLWCGLCTAGGETLFSFVFSYVLAKLKHTRLNVRY